MFEVIRNLESDLGVQREKVFIFGYLVFQKCKSNGEFNRCVNKLKRFYNGVSFFLNFIFCLEMSNKNRRCFKRKIVII